MSVNTTPATEGETIAYIYTLSCRVDTHTYRRINITTTSLVDLINKAFKIQDI